MDQQKVWTGERLETFIFSENTNEHLHRYAVALEFCRNKDVLDIASGEGYGTNLLAAVANTVTGVDIDESAIENARKKYLAANLHFLTGTASAIPMPDNCFDIVVSFETLEHHDKHKEMMQEIKRVLKPDGILIISSPDKKYYSDLPGYKNPFHVKELYKTAFEELLKAYFKETQFYSQRSFTGSVIVAQAGNADGDDPKLYSGNYRQITHTGMQAQYSICIASDQPLPASKSSFFNGESVLKKQFKELEDYTRHIVTEEVASKVREEAALRMKADMERSKTYRIGRAVISPLLLFKKLF